MAGRLKGKEGHHGRRGKKGVVAEIRHQACTSIVFLRERAHHAQSVHRMFGRCASRDMPEREREREREKGRLIKGRQRLMYRFARSCIASNFSSFYFFNETRTTRRSGRKNGGGSKQGMG